ncbi:MAG: sugar phosphate nucleotidyltransferase [Bacteriovoracaceae bacterium]|jgi:mannose-1-phosphate guanylyltransferase|nr:sugar phosphate nucleotidyltransferase [Bacteriovoracaceae bacterium]
MKVDYVLILAAGKGTRMGDIGKQIPKVIWPIFNKRMLDLEIEYAKAFHPQKIFINLYNYKDKIFETLKSRNDISFLIEEEVLDIGGAVHNLAQKVDYKGKLLVINSDQFIMLGQVEKEAFIKNDSDATILTKDVDPKDGYNALDIKNEKVIGIIPNKDCLEHNSIKTYTGMSIINLDKIVPIQGESKFFDTVINFSKLDVGHLDVSDCEYWDFGTIDRYKNSLERVLKSDSAFKTFLEENSVKIPLENETIKLNDFLTFSNGELLI